MKLTKCPNKCLDTKLTIRSARLINSKTQLLKALKKVSVSIYYEETNYLLKVISLCNH